MDLLLNAQHNQAEHSNGLLAKCSVNRTVHLLLFLARDSQKTRGSNQDSRISRSVRPVDFHVTNSGRATMYGLHVWKTECRDIKRTLATPPPGSIVLYCGRVSAANAHGCTAAECLLYKPWSLVVPTCTARCLHQRPW